MRTIELHQSSAKVWRWCHAQYDYKYNRKLKRRRKARPLMFGSLIHDALELQLAGKTKEVELLFKQYDKEIKEHFEEERIEFDLDSVVPNARIVLRNYVEYWKNDGLKYLKVEFPFETEIAKGVIFAGKVDAVVADDTDRGWLFERKTCKQMPQEDVRMHDIQTVAYFDILPKAGYRRKLEGVIWDYVRSKPPSVPEPLKSGALSRAKIDTTPEVYLEAIKKAKLDPADYSDMLESLEPKRDSFYRRIARPISKEMRKNVLADLVTTGEQIRDYGHKWKDRNLTFRCNQCEFQQLCAAEVRGLDTDYILKREYEVDNDKAKVKQGPDED